MSGEGAAGEGGPGGPAGTGAAADGPAGDAPQPALPAGMGLALAVLALLAVVAVLAERDGSPLGGGAEPVPPSAAALSVYDGRSPSEPGNGSLRVLVELPRPPLADRDDLDALSAADQRAYVRSLEREGESLRSALGARGRGAARRGPLRPHLGRLRRDRRHLRPRLAVEPRRARAPGPPLLSRDE